VVFKGLAWITLIFLLSFFFEVFGTDLSKFSPCESLFQLEKAQKKERRKHRRAEKTHLETGWKEKKVICVFSLVEQFLNILWLPAKEFKNIFWRTSKGKT